MTPHTPIRSSRRLVAIVILILQMNLFVAAFDGDANMAPHTSSEQHVEDHESCDMERSLERLRTIIPQHLHPEALQYGGRGVGNEDNQGIWKCPEDETNRLRSDFYLGLHCEDMELLFSLYNSDEMTLHPQDVLGFDYQLWCNRPNANNTKVHNVYCDLCTDGMIMKQHLHDSIFNDDTPDERFQLTCAEASEYAQHITNEERCQGTLEQARTFCCEILSSATRRQKLKPGDIPMTLILILLVTGVSNLMVHGSLWAMEFIDDYWFSWEQM
mmetsp:Transcript_40005/g.96536  ORF Transcript_40005/g.96536 Transcript_40005/m.96536 type:complete len:271 (-) Transcript_40005:1105-1917(-)